ncbi:MAG TPA: ATP-dependent DNA helicase RecG [Candidatus Saccharimonadales bacterium]|nr:ATP-dependent DNA helicase RecG [Candidatus Saccharimonadales bacterium]
MTLDSPVTELKGVGDTLAKLFNQVGVKTVGQLLDYFPRRYEDYSTLTPINQLKPGPVSIQAVIKQASGRYVRRGMHVTEAVASDATGSLRLVWFNQPYRAAALKPGREYFISGQYELRRQRFAITNPSLEMVSDLPVNTARILAIYRETKGLNSRQIRAAVSQAFQVLDDLPESLPQQIVLENELISHHEALRGLHLPASAEQLAAARRRLGYEEVFQLSLASLLNKQENQAELAQKIPYKEESAISFARSLPFKLTDAQRLAVMRIYKDLAKDQPMNRLLEGDVGSGKTAVATMGALMALEQGWQVALMAPTELLARQHAETVYQLLQPLKLEDQVLLLVGSLKPAQKTKARQAIADGKVRFLVGTHALIQDQVDMHKLALTIIDEQHRFGVEQRKTLMAKAGRMPHVLSLTATPIPRSLALTLYGELDISILHQKPPGRQPIVTEVVSPNSRPALYQKIDQELETGRQMFVVCPLISESATVEANSVEKIYRQLSQHDFKHRRVGLLHGQLKADEKQRIMQKFVDHELDILVSTTVIEVGVDVANASIMLIESAERFGLAQLHQLRGRVGRGKHQGYCYLMLSDSKAPTKRLRAMESTDDGFKLAELDLELRGPGAIYGTLQHGQLDLRIAKLSDTRLIAAARASAQEFIDKEEDLLKYKELAGAVQRLRSVTNLN